MAILTESDIFFNSSKKIEEQGKIKEKYETSFEKYKKEAMINPQKNFYSINGEIMEGGGESVPEGIKKDDFWGFFFFSFPEISIHGNEIYFDGTVTQESMNYLRDRIMWKLNEIQHLQIEYGFQMDKPYEMNLNFTSPGGNIHAGFSFIDSMCRNSKIPVVLNTTILGSVASMGTIICLAGKKRRMSKHASLHIHQISSGIRGTRNEMKDTLKSLENLHKNLRNFILEKTKIKTEKEVEDLMDRESYFTAEEALELGFIDEII